MYTVFGNSNVDLCKDVGKIDTFRVAKNRFLEKNISVFKFTYLEEYFTDRRSQGVKI